MKYHDETQRDRLARDIFLHALEIESLEGRAAYLERASGNDDLLRSRLQVLLQSHRQDSFLEQPAVETAAATLPVVSSEPLGVIIGRYKLLQKVGEGGCGAVYMAEQEEPVRRRVALKVIKLGMDTKSVIARFEAERQALALMDHPNIARVLDAGATDTGRPYFVMELVRGIKITEYCDQQNLTTRDRLDLFIKVCQAIQHAHQKGIIHRDIKPSNILVTLHDGVPVPKVIDFGIAKATTGQRLTNKTLFTALEQFIGTPAYMSPEQAEMSGLDIDTRCDIYSLGVLLYEMLTSKTPFDAQELLASGLDQMRRTIREQEPVRPSTRLRTMLEGELTTTAKHRQSEALKLIHLLRGDLDWIVMKCLEKDRARRYETANGLGSDIQRHLDNQPVIARPPSTAYRFKKLVRRNKFSFAAAAVVTIALILGVVTTSWQAVRAKTAQRETARLLAQSQRLAYSLNLNLAQADWEQNNPPRFWQLIEDTRSDANRGFEWYYWQREMHREVQTLRGHLDRVMGLSVSLDGQRVATGSSDRTAKVWELSTGREVSTFRGHTSRIRSVAFFPNGEHIVSCGDDGTAWIWKAATGRETRLLQQDAVSIKSVAISSEPLRIISGNDHGIVRIWEADTGRELRTFRVRTRPGHTNSLWSVAISADGERILAGSADGDVNIWDLHGSEVPRVLSHNKEGKGIWSVVFSPDEKEILSAGFDGTAKLWDVESGKFLQAFIGHQNWIFSARFSSNGERILTSSADNTLRIWAKTGAELQQIKGTHRSGPWSAAFVSNDRIVTTSGEGDHTTKVWDLATASGPLTLTNRANVWSVAFSNDGLLATGGQDGMIKIWDATNGRLERVLPRHSSIVHSLAFSSDGRRLATSSEDRTASVWDLASDREPLLLKGHQAAINSIAFSPDERRIATASDDGTVRLWDARNGQEELTFRAHEERVRAVAFSPAGDWIVSGGEDFAPRVWSSSNGQQRQRFVGTEDSMGIYSLAVSQDGRLIAAARWMMAATVWDAATGERLFEAKGHNMELSSVAFSPDTQRLATGSTDRLVKVWDTSSGRELLTLRGHGDAVKCVAFSSDGLRIASGSLDGTAKIWTAATPEQVSDWRKAETAAEQRLGVLRH